MLNFWNQIWKKCRLSIEILNYTKSKEEDIKLIFFLKLKHSFHFVIFHPRNLNLVHITQHATGS